MILEFFPLADVKEETASRIEFYLDSADENLSVTVNRMLNKLKFEFSLIERTKDFRIHVILKKEDNL